MAASLAHAALPRLWTHALLFVLRADSAAAQASAIRSLSAVFGAPSSLSLPGFLLRAFAFLAHSVAPAALLDIVCTALQECLQAEPLDEALEDADDGGDGDGEARAAATPVFAKDANSALFESAFSLAQAALPHLVALLKSDDGLRPVIRSRAAQVLQARRLPPSPRPH